jgi:hypothetical protein
MKYVLLTGMLLFNYCIENIQLSYSKNKQHYQVVAISNFMSRKAIVSIDFDVKNFFGKSNSIKKMGTANSIYALSYEGWMMFTAML